MHVKFHKKKRERERPGNYLLILLAPQLFRKELAGVSGWKNLVHSS
jgi:hypothetical protein